MARRLPKRRRVLRRGARRISRYSRRTYKRSYARRGRAYGRRKRFYGRRKVANEYVCVRASFTGDPVTVTMQGASQDSFQAFQVQFNGLVPFQTTNPVLDLVGMYQKYRIKRVTCRFIPNKRMMTGQMAAVVGGNLTYLNPPRLDIYEVPIYDKQTFAAKSDLSDIIEQGGYHRKVADRPFSSSFIPKVEQIKQYNLLGNTYATVRRPWFPTDGEGTTVLHFGRCVYIRRPYDPLLIGGATYNLLQYQIEVTAMIEFKGMN